MTNLHHLDLAADRHASQRPAPSGASTFDTVRAASAATRAKGARLRNVRMDREDAAAAICLPDLTGRAPR
jgi:hypothetical protein